MLTMYTRHRVIASWLPNLAMLLLLGIAIPAQAAIINPSFENPGGSEAVGPDGWTKSTTSGFAAARSGAASDGSLSMYLYKLNSATVTAGEYGSYSQSVDLTGIDLVLFDVYMTHPPCCQAWPSQLEASVYVGNDKLWSANSITSGWELDHSIDTSLYSGFRNLEFRLEALGTESSGSSHFRVDHLRAVPEPGSGWLLGIGLMGLATRRWQRVGRIDRLPAEFSGEIKRVEAVS
jgi:hypothetical protein